MGNRLSYQNKNLINSCRQSLLLTLILIVNYPGQAAEPSPTNSFSVEHVTYMILAETVEPIMIVSAGDPMAGGILTEIVKLIYQDSNYIIDPLVLPWQRMNTELDERDDWILHGFPDSSDTAARFELSEQPIFPFNHVAVTLRDNNFKIQEYEDFNDRTLILIENFQYPGLDRHLESILDGDIDSNVRVVRAFSPSGALEMLRHRRGDVVIGWQARMIYNLESAGLSLADVEFHNAMKIVPTNDAHLIFSPHQPDSFRNFVNQRIRALTQSGQLYEIVEKYYSPFSPPQW